MRGAHGRGSDDGPPGKAFDPRLARRLWHYVKPHRGLVAGAVALVIAGGIVQLAQPWLVGRTVDVAILPGSRSSLLLYGGLFAAALALEFVLRYAQLYGLEKLGQAVIYDLRTTVFAHIQSLSSSFFDRQPVGRLVSRVTSDVEAIHEAFTSGLVMILADLVKLLAIVVILIRMDWKLALVSFTILPPMALASFYFRIHVRGAYRTVRKLVGELNGYLQENVGGMRLVQLFLRERAHAAEFGELNTRHRDAELKSVRYESAFSAIAELLGSITLAAIVWAGGWRLLDDGITFGVLVAFVEYSRRFFRPLQELSQRYTVMQSAMAAAERLFAILDTEPKVVSPATPQRPERAKGRVVFEDVRFAYREGEPVLHGIDLAIEPGERVAVVGWTGSGKSTLVRLLCRLYDVKGGLVLVDGVDVRERALAELRRSIGVVLQEPFLFAGSVLSNISLGDPAIDAERVRAAARAVGADRFIERLPGGYDEPVREHGSNFSLGEKQLLCFARALAFDPAIVVLDEATASVDPETEARIQAALDTLLAGRTSIVIAHRLSTIESADRILVMHKGKLVEEGHHDELIARSGGIYRTLYQLQTANGTA